MTIGRTSHSSAIATPRPAWSATVEPQRLLSRSVMTTLPSGAAREGSIGKGEGDAPGMTNHRARMDEHLAVREQLAWQRVEDEVIVLDIGSSRYMSLNASAAVLWDAVARGATREELARVLLETY